MTDPIEIEIVGLDRIMTAFDQFPKQVARNFSMAAHEAGNEILDTTGLRDYPNETAANQTPTPYYIRGRGMQYATRNDGRSENLGKQFYIRREGSTATIGNRASYAKWVIGQTQAGHMAAKGWRKMAEVAKEKIDSIREIYQNWVNKTLIDLGF